MRSFEFALKAIKLWRKESLNSTTFSVFRFFRAKVVQIPQVENTLGRKPEQRAIEWCHKNWVVPECFRSKIVLENSVLNFLENVQLLQCLAGA